MSKNNIEKCLKTIPFIPNIKKLSISCILYLLLVLGIDSNLFEKVCITLKYSPQIQLLDASANNIDDKGILSIIENSLFIPIIDLSDNKITDNGAKLISENIQYFEGVNIINNNIGDKGIEYILPYLYTLKYSINEKICLNLEYTGITDKGIMILFNYPNHYIFNNIEIINLNDDLCFNNITEKSIDIIKNNLKYFPKLKHLNGKIKRIIQ